MVVSGKANIIDLHDRELKEMKLRPMIDRWLDSKITKLQKLKAHDSFEGLRRRDTL